MTEIINIDVGPGPLVAWIEARIHSGVRVIALEGFCGRGKSTLARTLCAAIPRLGYLDGDLYAISHPIPCNTWRDWMRCDALQVEAWARRDAAAAVLVESAVAWGALGELTSGFPAVRVHLRALQTSGIHTDDLECAPGLPSTPFSRTLCDYHSADGLPGARADLILEWTPRERR